jgi:hypothetical protein
MFDSVSTALARRIANNGVPDAAAASTAYKALSANPRFIEGYIGATANEENVKKRMEEAEKAFANI